MPDTTVHVHPTAVLVYAGDLRYVHVEAPHVRPAGHNEHGEPTRMEFVPDGPILDGDPIRRAIDDLVQTFDEATCATCVSPIGAHLVADGDNDREAFAEFYAAQVGNNPVVLLCIDCASIINALLGRS